MIPQMAREYDGRPVHSEDTVTCSSCGSEVPVKHRYCGICGSDTLGDIE